MNARADFEQAQDEQEHMERCVQVLERIENWQHTREDILLLVSALGLSQLYNGEQHGKY